MGRRVGGKKVHLGVIEHKGKYHKVCWNDPDMLMLLCKHTISRRQAFLVSD